MSVEAMEWTHVRYTQGDAGWKRKELAKIAERIVAWINTNGGEARYEPAEHCIDPTACGDSHRAACIVIRGPHSPVYVKPGQWVVMGEWFELYDSRVGYRDGERREFTVSDTEPVDAAATD